MEHHTAPPPLSPPAAPHLTATPQSDALRLPALLTEAKRQAIAARRFEHSLAQSAPTRLLTLTSERRARLEPAARGAIEAARHAAEAALAFARAVQAELRGS